MPVLTDINNGLLRYTTQAFIDEDPTVIALQRETLVAKPGGYHDKTRAAIAPQTFRLVNQTPYGGIQYSGSDDETHSFQFIMVGRYDADIEIDDIWVDGESQYHVDSIMATNSYEKRADVTCFAMDPGHG